MAYEEIKEAVQAWRAASPMVTKFWWSVQDAAIMAIQAPGYCYGYRSISFGVQDDVLYCKLPSGRTLTYHQPRIQQKMMPWGKETTCITYMGWNSNYLNGPVGWMRLESYGPKLVENICQAVARDLLAHGMMQLDAAGYPIVLHVHDEIVAEVPAGTGSIEEFERLMSTMPSWAAGWPVRAAGGWRGLRYRKG
jgi:DNA polymerase